MIFSQPHRFSKFKLRSIKLMGSEPGQNFNNNNRLTSPGNIHRIGTGRSDRSAEQTGHDSGLTGVHASSSIRGGESSEGESLHYLTRYLNSILEPVVGYGGSSEPLSSSDSTCEGVR